MAKKIKLKDHSFYLEENARENKSLYNKLKEQSRIIIDTSICYDVSGEEIKPIIELKKSSKPNMVEITTFGYVGRFSAFGVEFDITYRFGESLLDRMIGVVNDFDIKTLEYESKHTQKKSDNLAIKILYINFILKLEKFSVLGLPKSYERIEHHDSKFKGQIDINRFIKKDMPFTGKVATISHEQRYVQEIVDLLYSALRIVENSMSDLLSDRLLSIKNLLYHHANRRLVDANTMHIALGHKSLQNALYSEFKKILEIAKYIILYEHQTEYKSKELSNGLVFDVSLLWENYLYKLLKNAYHDSDWEVIHEEKNLLYDGMFYERHIYPDIIIKHKFEKKVLIFDAKSKKMNFDGKNKYGAGDLDRNDFFQINTYMSYYQNQGYKVIAGGLLYPMKGEFIKDKCHSNHWLGNEKTKFIIDGLELSEMKIANTDIRKAELELSKMQITDIIKAENDFVERIKKITKPFDT